MYGLRAQPYLARVTFIFLEVVGDRRPQTPGSPRRFLFSKSSKLSVFDSVHT